MVIFDWDNTLFPTKALQLMHNRPGKHKYSEEERDALHKLSKWVHRVLRAYISMYSAQNLAIVTSAANGWIEKGMKILGSIGRWSQIAQIIEKLPRIDITCPEQAMLPFKSANERLNYKHTAFVNTLAKKKVSMLISVGDSKAEFRASKKCAEVFEGMAVGRVKLRKHPTVKCMTRQLQFMMNLCQQTLTESFDIDVSARKELDG